MGMTSTSDPDTGDTREPAAARGRHRSRAGRRIAVIAGASAFAVIVLVAAGLYWFVLRSTSTPQPALVLTPVAATGPLDGTWSVVPGAGSGDDATTWVGYRVGETLAGVHRDDAGRSPSVTGSMQIAGTTVSAISISGDLSKLATDNAQRDASVRNILDANDNPNATFTSTAPVQLPSVPSPGSSITVPVTGSLTLHGTTHTVTVSLQARWDGSHVEVIGQLPISFADYGIQIPEIPGVVKADDHGSIEVQLFLDPRR
jgi:polyisoprenoid-binding protein YceI